MSSQDKSSDKSSLVMNDLRLTGVFCDAVIKVGDVEFPVHRVVLCECSPYFLAFFKRWATPEQKVFSIPDISPDIMQLIIEFAYTGCVSVTEDNAQDLLVAADRLIITDIVKTCCDFLEEQLCSENCIGIFQLTNFYFFPALQSKAYRYILNHFEEVVFSEEFLQLSLEELTNLLGRDDLSVRKESTVFEAILRWIAHSPKEREGHIAVLLSKVRLALMSQNYMSVNVMLNELVNNNAECQFMVREASETIDRMVANRAFMSPLCNPLIRPRLPNTILLAFGGWSGNSPTNGIEAYDVRANYWLNVTNNHEQPRAYHGIAFLDGNVYSVGGFNRVEYFNSVRRFDLSSHTWHEVAPMYDRRCYVSVTVLNGYIYALGGFDGVTRLSTAERYRPETNQWSLIAPMNEIRSDASCTTLHDKVYICGGFNGTVCLQTAECYDPANNQWWMISLMTSPRSGTGIIACAGHVYAVGGFDGVSRLRSAEAYNPRTDTWHEVSSMSNPRSNFGIEVLEEQIFVVGGFNGSSTTDKVELFNPTTNEWSEASDMEIIRSALSCCVVSCLPNMDEYTIPRDSLPVLDFVDDSLNSAESGDSA